MGVLVTLALNQSLYADTKVVDPSGGGDYTTIRAAVNDLTNSGPRTIIVRAGIYHEAVLLSARNTQATNESQRIVIMADTNAASGAVMIVPTAGGSGVYLSRSKFITLQGLAITGTGSKGMAVDLEGGSKDNEDIAIVGCQIYQNAGNGIRVQSGNPRTWIMNNLIRDNGATKNIGHGVTIANGVGATVYLVNNTIVRNKFDGVCVGAKRTVYLVNNLIAGNGRYGLERASGSSGASAMTLLNNMFYANMILGDIALASKTLDAADSGNRTTTGNEGVGLAGCTFANCGRTTALTGLFVNPSATATNFHLAADSPAIDRGVNTFWDGTTTWVIAEDLDGNPRPQDGDGDCLALADVGCYEAPAISCQANAVSPLASLLAGDGSSLVSNVNAQYLGGLGAASYATTTGTYPGMTVGTAINALNLGNVPPGGYTTTNQTAAIINALLGKAATNQNVSLFPNDAGYITSGGGGVTNRWLLNGGPILTSDELQVVTAGGLNGVLSNYGARVQLTLSNAASALAQSLSNVLAVGNVSGTGIVMSAQDGTNSYELLLINGNGLTNQFFGSGSNLVHIVPAGQTNVIWDSGNLATNNLVTQTQLGGATNNANLAANGVLTNGATVALHGTIDNAVTAGTATTWTGSNTLAGIIVSSTNGLWTSATNLVTATSNTLASAIASNLPLQGYKYVIVAEGTSDVQRGTNLLAAYTTATALSPSAISRVAVIVPPGNYNLGSSAGLVMDTPYVDLIGLVPVQQTTKQVFTDFNSRTHTMTIAAIQNVTVIYNNAANPTINQTADNVHIESLTLSNANGSGVAYNPLDAGTNTVLRHVAMSTMTEVIEYAGLYIDCVGGDHSFGYWPDASSNSLAASGTFIDCVGGARSFGRGGIASGTFRDCVAGGDNGFGGGGGVASGTFIGCVGGDGGFGGGGIASGTFIGCVSSVNGFGGYDGGIASGTFIDCVGDGNSFGGGSGEASGTFRDCVGGDGGFGGGGIASGTFRDCVGGDGGFGGGGVASGTFIGCVGGVDSFGGDGIGASGTFRDCVGGYYSFGGGDAVLDASAKLYHCKGGDGSFGNVFRMASDDFNYNVGGATTFLMLPNLPTDPSGLPGGAVYQINNVLMIVPMP